MRGRVFDEEILLYRNGEDNEDIDI